MANKRFALVVRLWQVKDDQPLFTTGALVKSDSISAETDLVHCYHWRGAVQVAGDTRLHYFNSLQEMHQLISHIVEPPVTDQS